MLAIPARAKREALQAARRLGVSFNEFARQALADYVARLDADTDPEDPK